MFIETFDTKWLLSRFLSVLCIYIKCILIKLSISAFISIYFYLSVASFRI